MRRTRGYTVTELMLAIVVLAIALTAIMGLLTMAVVVHKKAQARAIAVVAAQTKIEELRRVPIASLANSTFAVTGLDNGGTPVGAVTVTTTSAATMRKVTVTLTWIRPTKGTLSLETVFIE